MKWISRDASNVVLWVRVLPGANERSEIDNGRTRTDCHTAIRGIFQKKIESCRGQQNKTKRQRTAYGLWITPDRNRPIMLKSYPHYSQVIYTAVKSLKRTMSVIIIDNKRHFKIRPVLRIKDVR